MDAAPLIVPTLAGRIVRLEPLSDAHVEELIAASGENRDTYAYTTVPHGRDEIQTYLQVMYELAGRGENVPFAQVKVAADTVVGVTRFLSPRYLDGRAEPYAVEIGGTWLSASAQRTGVNVEAKLLLLSYAFDVWNVARVEFKTDARNVRSRDAIAALGATFEGILRNWQPSHAVGEDGLVRDTAMYAVVASDWPAVRSRLVGRLAV